jgi:hypothetical protein
MSSAGWRKIALGAIALAGVFGIGFFAGRELFHGREPPGNLAWTYTLKEFGKAPPALLGYRLLREVGLELREPRGIAVGPDGRLYVCGDRAVLELDAGGGIRRRRELEGEPACVAVGGDGSIYLGMQDHLEVLDPAGDSRSWPDLGSEAIVTSIAVTSAGVFVADAGNRAVLRLDPGGMLVGRIGEDYRIPSPYFDVAPAPDGTLWVADTGRQTLRRYTVEGRLLASWGRASLDIDGFGGCCNPAQLAALPCGRLVTGEKGLLRVKVYEPDGTLRAVVALPADFPPGQSGMDLATRKANGGEILVLVPGKRVVRIYAPKGEGEGAGG